MYDLLVNCIPGELIIRYFMERVLRMATSADMKHEIVYWCSFHENRMQMGNKPIFHIEALMARIMLVIRKAQEELEQMMN